MGDKIRVLLADDHVMLREATAELVDHQPDMEVVGQAGTGEETIALTRALHPDVVVMDIAMPRGNGLEATRRIAAECPGTQVLVLTAHEDAEHVIPLLEAGALGYLPKTVSLNELLDAIRATSRGESVLPPSVASVVVQHLAGKEGAAGRGRADSTGDGSAAPAGPGAHQLRDRPPAGPQRAHCGSAPDPHLRQAKCQFADRGGSAGAAAGMGEVGAKHSQGYLAFAGDLAPSVGVSSLDRSVGNASPLVS